MDASLKKCFDINFSEKNNVFISIKFNESSDKTLVGNNLVSCSLPKRIIKNIKFFVIVKFISKSSIMKREIYSSK